MSYVSALTYYLLLLLPDPADEDAIMGGRLLVRGIYGVIMGKSRCCLGYGLEWAQGTTC